MQDDPYKFAAQNRLRFPSQMGDLTTEQLFELVLNGRPGRDLESIAQELDAQLTASPVKSFTTDADPKVAPGRKRIEMAFAVVKDVIATRRAAAKAVADQRDLKAKRDKLLDALAAAEGKALSGLSVEDLKKRLDALDAPTPAA